MSKHRAFIGIDVGGTKLLFALFDHAFNVIEAIKAKTRSSKGVKPFEETFNDSLEQLLKRAKKDDLIVDATGIGCAGSIDRTAGVVRESPNIPFLKGYSFNRFSKLTKTPIVLDNDAHMGLYGEQQLGAAKGLNHVIGIFVGTGIGGALMINGQPYYGASGEAGRLPLLDEVLSRGALAADAALLATKHQAPHLKEIAGSDVQKMRAGVIAEAIKEGDKAVEERIRHRARRAGEHLATLVSFMNPEMIVLGGGVVEALPQLFLKEISQSLRHHLAPELQKSVKVELAKLQDHYITAGAAKRAWDQLNQSNAVQSPRH